MVEFKLVVAVCRNGGIGKGGKLPWKIKEDLAYFSKLTRGRGNNAIVMGRKTWESIGSTPLTKRENLILSTSMPEGVLEKGKSRVFSSLENLLSFCEEKKYDDVWIAGGAGVYEQFIEQKLVGICSITFIDEEFGCDTFFPKLDDKWKLTYAAPMESTHKANIEIRQIVHQP
jgi:dihydrofolate reductase